MSITYGKRQIEQMIDTLNGDYEDVVEAAEAALDTATQILMDRARFVVVGQLQSTHERPYIAPDDPEAIKVALGFYSTEGDALRAAGSLWYSNASGDTFKSWVLPLFHGTPADLHNKQKEKYAEAEAKRAEKASERMKADIAKRQAAMEERARGGRGSCVNCQHQPYDHLREGSGRGRCGYTDCDCTTWKENTKREEIKS